MSALLLTFSKFTESSDFCNGTILVRPFIYELYLIGYECRYDQHPPF